MKHSNYCIISLMASKPLHHPTFLFFFLFSFLAICIKLSNSTKPCSSFDCGNGITIGYPFWPQIQESKYCGYKGFGVSCNEKSPTLNISNHVYKIKNFNESNKSFAVIIYEQNDQESDDLDQKCPVVRHDVMLNSSSMMDYATRDVKIMHFFYNCSLYPPSVQDISCFRFGTKRSYLFLDGSVPEFDWEKFCNSVVKVPLIDQMVNYDHANGDFMAKGFGKALIEGFKLRWKPDIACQFCEASGGFCGQRTIGINQKFICFCNGDQIHHFHCQDSGALMSISSDEQKYISSGLVIFAGLMAASFVLYHISFKKISISRNEL